MEKLFSTYCFNLFFLFLLCSTQVFCIDVEFRTTGYDANAFRSIDNNDYGLAALTLDFKSNGIDIGHVLIFDGVNWKKLPDTTDNTKSPFYGAYRIKYDKNGDIYLIGKSVYKYSGGKWNEYFIDDEYRNFRKYRKIAIDGKNELFIGTLVADTKNTFPMFSEILKFNGSKFKTILKKYSSVLMTTNNYTEPISYSILSDSSLVTHIYLNKNAQDYDSTDLNDVYVVNDSGIEYKLKIETPADSGYEGYNKHLSHIFPENPNKIWFLFARAALSGKEGTYCSGLSLYENGKWTVFDDKYNFPHDPKYPQNFAPMYKMLKFNDKYLILGQEMNYIMDNNYNLDTISWERFLDKFIIYKPSKNWSEDHLIEEVNRLIYNDKSKYFNEVLEFKGKIWLMCHYGLIVANKDAITDIEAPDLNEYTLYPNPVNSILFIDESFEYFKIYDNQGDLIVNTTNNTQEIDVSNLSPGHYFIMIFKNGIQTLLKFIKY